MKVWATANQKGGVGKTTSAVTLAGVMQKRGYRVLLVDLDPHGSLTSYFGEDPDSVDRSAYDLYQQSLKNALNTRSVIHKTKFNRLDFIPASSALATLDRQLGAKDGMGLVMKKAVLQIQDDYDFVIIDCPPMLGLLMVNALASCERLLIPVQTEFLALKGLERMVHTMSMIQKARKQQVCYSVIPTFYDQRLKASNETLKTLRSQYKDHIWSGVIPIDTQFREASQKGIPLSIERISCKGSRAYSHLLDYLLELDESALSVAGGCIAMSGANESAQDKAIHDYLEALLLEIPDEIDEAPINEVTPQVKLVETDIQSLPHKEPVTETPVVIGLENLVAQVPVALAEVETITVTEVETTTVVETVTEAVTAVVESEIPDWAEERFQCLLFNVSGLSLAVPLVKLNSVISWDEDKITETPNQTNWYLGLVRHLEKQVKVIDTALLVLPENRRESMDTASLNRLGNILLVDDFKWGLACDSIGDVIWLNKEDVKWRKNKQTRAWLSGTSLEHLCAIIDTEVFAKMLTEASS